MRGKDELIHEVESLGIKVPPGGTKDDLMDLLATSHREHDITGRPLLLPQLSVMLARNVKDLNDCKLDKMINCPRGLWIAEEKLDGVRAKLHLSSNGNRIDSRHRSDITYEYVEKTAGLPHLRDLRYDKRETILDGELLMPVDKISKGKTVTADCLTSTTAVVNSKPERAIQLQRHFGRCCFHAFDILTYRGDDIRNETYRIRYTLLNNVLARLYTLNTASTMEIIKRPTRAVSELRTFHDIVINAGGEGIMLKRLDWPYEGNKRSKGIYKWKRQREVDCFITGFVPGKGEFSGLIGTLLVSVHTKDGTQEIAAIQPGDFRFRKSISLLDGSLRDDMYGKVVEISYLSKTKNNRLRHAVLSDKGFRPDKNMYDCKESFDAANE